MVRDPGVGEVVPKGEPLIPQIRVTREQRNRLVLVGVAGLVLLWLLWQSWGAMAPFVLALVLGYLMSPLVDLFHRVMPRTLAVLLVYAVFVAIVVGLSWWLAPALGGQLKDLADQTPTYQRKVEEWIAGVTTWYQSLPVSDEARKSFEDAVRGAAGSLFGVVQQGATNVLKLLTRTTGILVGLLIIPFWLFYVLKDSEKGMNAINEMLPRAWRMDIWRIVRIINGVLSNYIRGQLLLALVVGLATTVGMVLVGAPFAFVLGLISGFTEVIPVIGPVLGAVPGVILALFTGDWVVVVKVLLVYVVVQQLENNLLVPKIQGDSVKLHPAVIMVSLVVGSQVAGLFGLIVAVPMAAIMRDVYLYLYRRLTEDYTSREAEASVPSRADEESSQDKQRTLRELEEAHGHPGINTADEMIAELEEESEAPVSGGISGSGGTT